jgi:hypothetical protein
MKLNEKEIADWHRHLAAVGGIDELPNKAVTLPLLEQALTQTLRPLVRRIETLERKIRLIERSR